MCIAIMNGFKTTLKKDWVRNSWENNGDGAGLLWVNDGKLEIFKEMTTFDTYYNKYIEVRKEFPKSNILLHFRISTHGKINTTNCHPFLVDKTIGFIHNGMIHQVERNTEFSDTYMFNELILKKLPKGFEKNVAMQELLHNYIDSSKLVFLNNKNEPTIINEEAGHWVGDTWFSNSSYKQVNSWVDYGGTKKAKSSVGYGSQSWYGGASFGTSWDKTSAWGGSTMTTQKCSSCDTYLYSDEIIDGVCCDCAEVLAMETLEMSGYNEYSIADDLTTYECQCDGCDEQKVVKWNVQYAASLCKTCENDLALTTQGVYTR